MVSLIIKKYRLSIIPSFWVVMRKEDASRNNNTSWGMRFFPPHQICIISFLNNNWKNSVKKFKEISGEKDDI